QNSSRAQGKKQPEPTGIAHSATVFQFPLRKKVPLAHLGASTKKCLHDLSCCAIVGGRGEAMPAATTAHVITPTLLETVKRCQKKAEYRYVRGYVPRVKGTKIERGTWIHELLAAFYGAIKDGRDGLVAAGSKHQQLLEEWWNPLFDEEKELLGKDLPDQAWKIFERYTLYWEDHDRKIMRKILWVEQEITIKLDWLPAPFTFKCDLVFLNQWNQVVIMDHKVVGTIPDEEDRLLDNQGPR